MWYTTYLQQSCLISKAIALYSRAVHKTSLLGLYNSTSLKLACLCLCQRHYIILYVLCQLQATISYADPTNAWDKHLYLMEYMFIKLQAVL